MHILQKIKNWRRPFTKTFDKNHLLNKTVNRGVNVSGAPK